MKPVQKSASELLKEHHSIGSERQSLLGGKHQPLLGRGVVPGSDHVDLFSPPPSLAKVTANWKEKGLARFSLFRGKLLMLYGRRGPFLIVLHPQLKW